MGFQKYTEAELFLFKQKDKRIMWQSIFSSLCTLYANEQKNEESFNVMLNTVDELVDDLQKKFPTEEAEKTPEYRDKELNEEIEKTEKKLQTLKNIKDGKPF